MDWTNYNHIFYFWTVARHGSIRRASEELGLSQPTVSEQLHKLEEQMGLKLLERAGRGIRLSEDGKLLFSYAERIFHIGDEMRSALSGRTAMPQQLRLGVVPALAGLATQRLLAPALRHGSPLRLECIEDRAEPLLARLALYQLDVVLSDAPLPGTVSVRAFSHRLAHCGLSFLSARKPKGGARFPRRLDCAPFLMPEAGTALRSALEGWFELQKIRPVVVGEFSNSEMLAIFARQGLGAFAVPALLEREVRTRYGLEVLGRTAEIDVEFYAFTTERKSAHPAVRAIIEAGQKMKEGNGGQGGS